MRSSFSKSLVRLLLLSSLPVTLLASSLPVSHFMAPVFAQPQAGADSDGDSAKGGSRRKRFSKSLGSEEDTASSEAGNNPSPNPNPREKFRKMRDEGGEGPEMGRRMRRGMGGMGMGGGMGIGRNPLNLTALNLTEDQKNKIKTMRTQAQTKAKDLQNSLRTKRMEMRDMLFDPDASVKQIKAKHEEVRKIQEQVEGLMIDDFLSIRSVLTPEQKKKLPSLKPGGPGGPGGPAGPGGPMDENGGPPGPGGKRAFN